MNRNGQTNKGILLAAAVAATALSALATNAFAASYTFTNASGGNWSTTGNWQGSSAPTNDGDPSDIDVFLAGTTFTSGTTTISNDKGQTGSPKTVDLNALTLSGVGSNSGSGTRTINMTGDRLRFDTSTATPAITPTVNLDANNGSAVSVVYAVGENVVLNNNTTFQGDGTAGFTFSGAISGGGSLTKTGNSTLTLTGTSNSFTGGTNVNGGTLALRATNALPTSGAVSVGGGTLDIDGFNHTVGAVTLNGGSIVGTSGVLSASSYNVQSGSASAILDTATAVLTKSGSGTVTLSGNNTYGGGTAINAGTLAVSGAQTGGGNVTVSTGGTLAGTGTIGLKSAATVSVAGSGSTVAPGNGTGGNVGTLTLGTTANNNSVTFGGTGTLSIDVNGGTADKLAVVGGLTISSGATLSLNAVSPTAGLYQLVTYTGTRGGTTFAATGTPSGYKVVYGASSNGSIDLQHLATQSITGAAPATADAFVNSTIAASATLNNTAPSQSLSLGVSLGSTGSLTVGSLTSGSGTVTAGGSTAIGGTINTGTTSGAGKTWQITNTDANASNTTATGGGTVNVYDHASGSAANTTVTLPTVIVGYTSAQTSAGGVSVSNASTAGLRVKLDANASAAQGNVSLNSVTGVAAGSSGTGQANLATGQGVGAFSNTFTYTYADNTTGTGITSGANANLGTQTVTVQGDVLGHAAPTFSNNNVGGTVNVIQNTTVGQTVTLTNGTAGSHIAGLAIDALTMMTRSGSGVIAAGGSETLTANLNTSALGSSSQTFSVAMFDDHAYDGKGAASAGTQAFSTTVNVFQHADAQLATGTFSSYSNGTGDSSYTPVAPSQTLSNANHTIGIDFGTIWATPFDNPYPVYAYFDITNPLTYAVTVAMSGLSGGATATPAGTLPTWALQAADGGTFNVTSLAAGGVYHARVLFNTNDPSLYLPGSPFAAAWDISLMEDASVTGHSTTAQVLHVNASAIAVPLPASSLAGVGLLGGLGLRRFVRARRVRAESMA